MRSRKFLSLILVLCMVMQILPVFATETEVTEPEISNIRYIINDTFDNDSIGNWVEGASRPNNSYSDRTVGPEIAEIDGVKALYYKQQNMDGGTAKGNQAIIRNNLEDKNITFGNGKKYILKTRIRYAAGDIFLQANRPDDISKYVTSNANAEYGDRPYVILRTNSGGVQALKYDKRPEAEQLISETMAGKWFDVKVVFDGSVKEQTVTLADSSTKTIASKDGYTVSVKTENDSGSYSGSLSDKNYTVYEAAGYNTAAEDFNGFETLDSISFMLGYSNSDLYIDYIQLYEVVDCEATAELTSNAVKTDASIDIALTTEGNITEIPANAVSVKDASGNTVAGAQMFNATTGIISFKPEAALTKDTVYKVNLNSEALKDYGITVTNASEMLVVATESGNSVYKYHIYDTFEDGTTGGWAKLGTTASNVNVADGVMTLTTNATSDTTNGVHAKMRYEFGENKLLLDGNTKYVIETKVKMTAPTESFAGLAQSSFRINSPTDFSALNSESLQDRYYYKAFQIDRDKLQAPNGNGGVSDGSNWHQLSEITDADDVYGKWVTVKMVFDGKAKVNAGGKTMRDGYTITTQIEGEEAQPNDSGLYQGNSEVIYTAAGHTLADGFTSIDSLEFITHFCKTAYSVDYIKVYEIIADDITASVEETAQYNEPIKVAFAGADEITVPEDAVTLTKEDGTTTVEATNTYDAQTKILTVTPASKLTLGSKYKVNVDAAKLNSDVANYTGNASFTITAKDRGGLIIDDTFDDGSLGNWVEGKSNPKTNIGRSNPEIATIDEATGNKALLFKQDALGISSNNGGRRSIRNDFADANLTFGNGRKYVLKARVMYDLPATSGDVFLLANRPDVDYADTELNFGSSSEWTEKPYTILRMRENKVQAPIYDKRSWDAKTLFEESMKENWVDVEVVFDGTEYTRTVTLADGSTKSITSKDGYTVSAKTATSTGDSYSGSISDTNYTVYEAAGYDTTDVSFNGYGTLDSISFMFGYTANNLYIDYIQLREVTTEEVTATVSDRADYDGSIDVVFDYEVEDPSAAIALKAADGTEVSVAKTYNPTTKTLSLKPGANLAVGGVYTVNVDASAIKTYAYEYTGETEFNVLVLGENGLIIDDTFDDGSLGNWVEGLSNTRINIGASNPEITIIDEVTGNKGLLFTQDASGLSYNTGSQRIVRNDLGGAKLEFGNGKKYILKARVKHNLPSGSGDIFLQANRPNSTLGDYVELNSHEYNDKPYVILRMKNSAVEAPKAGSRSEAATLITEDMAGKWVNVEVVFDGTEHTKEITLADGTTKDTITSKDGYTVTAKTSANEGTYNGSLIDSNYSTYEVAGYNTEDVDNFNGFETLDSISFMFGPTADSLCIDYIQLYEIDNYDGYAQIPAGNTVKYDEAIKLKFYGAHPVLGIPDNAVVVRDSEGTAIQTSQVWDEKTNILSVKPKEGTFTKGEQYGLRVTLSALKAIGMNYIGTDYFAITARDDYENMTYSINNQFNEDGNAEGWDVGVSKSGYEATIEVKDGYLHFTAPNQAFQAGAEGSLTKLLGNGIELSEGKKIVIETKVKNLLANGAFSLYLNKPEDLLCIDANATHSSNYLLVKDRGQKNQILVPANRITVLPNSATAGNYVFAEGIGGSALDENGQVADPAIIDTQNKWIKYTITITDEEIYNLHLKAEMLDDNGNVTATYESTDVNRATIKTGFDAYQRVFGKIPGYSTFDDYADETKQAVIENMYKKWFSADRLTFGTGDGGYGSDYLIDYITVTQSAYERPFEATASASVPEYFEADEVVKPEFTLRGNTGTAFSVISAMYVDGKLNGTHFEKVTAESAEEFTYTDETGWTIPSSGKVVIKAFVWDNSFIPLCEAVSGDNIPSIQVYVDPVDGDDIYGDGSSANPVKTFPGAFRAANVKFAADTEGVYENTEIILEDGTYQSLLGVYVEGVNYPEGGLVIKAADGAKPVIDGGVQFKLSEAVQVEDEAVLGRLPSGVDTTKIYALDLTTKMSNIPSVSYPGTYNINDELKEFGIEVPEIATCEASVDGNLMTVARYPNEGYALTGAVSNVGVIDGTKITADNITNGFTFATSDTNINRWGGADQALMFGYWGYDWATQTVPLKSAGSGSITSEYPSVKGIREGARYYVYNLLEEIDTAGEYFIDRNTGSATYGTMFFYWPDGATADSVISVSSNNSILMTLNSNNITVDGLTFTGGRRYGVATGKFSSGNVIKNCEIKNTAQQAAWIDGTNNEITNCYIHDVNNGISLVGGDIPTLTRGDCRATNNTITRFSRLYKAYADAIHIYDVGNTASHNKIYDGEHLAIRFEGNYHEISYNDISNVLQEVDDAGAIYVGREWADRGNVIKNNYIHDISSPIVSGSPVAGIFLDDHYAGAYIEGNVFANIDGHGVRALYGREDIITNNLFVNCTHGGVAMRNATGAAASYTVHETGLNKLFEDIEAAGTTAKWQEEFPELYSIMNNEPYKSWGHTYTKNVTVNCATKSTELTDKWLANGEYVDICDSQLGSQVIELKKDISDNVKVDSSNANYASIIGGNFAVTADMVGINGFKTIDFANMKK